MYNDSSLPEKPGNKPRSQKLYQNLTVQVLLAILAGVIFGHFFPEQAVELKPLGDLFIKLIKMVIAPVVFLTVVTGIASIGDIKKVGKLGIKTIVYFEIITTLALVLGMVAINLFRPGEGMDTARAAGIDVTGYVSRGIEQETRTFLQLLMDIVPESLLGAFVHGDLLQVLFVAVIFGIAATGLGDKAKGVMDTLERLSHIMFRIIGMIMTLAPIGAFGAIAFTVGQFGIESLVPLGKLIVVAIGTMIFFVLGVLGAVGWYYGFSIIRFVRYFRDELFVVLGTGSSEPVLPRVMDKLQRLGCSRPVVGLVVPTGYSFNLDGSSIYLSMCTLFVAQAYGIHLDWREQFSILLILLVTSKGAAAVAGSGFVVLAATIAATGILPMEGLALLLGIDRFMSSVRAATNIIGNGVAALVMAKVEHEFDESRAVAEYRDYFRDRKLERI